jgi:phosphoribosylformylglycinamidine cyclo-ligase
MLGKWDTVGIDCVAMCVNDLICAGADPITFLDTITCGKNQPETVKEIVEGVAEGCRQAGCALIGGETAEHPGLMKVGEYDLQGFATGIVSRESIIDGSKVEAGDILIGLVSSGLHSNGFSLIRRIFKENLTQPDPIGKLGSLAEQLLAPTEIYVDAVRAAKQVADIHAIAHITGGGVYENIPRILPDNGSLTAHIACDDLMDYLPTHWRLLSFIREAGGLSWDDICHTFNIGFGMVLAVKACDAEQVEEAILTQSDTAALRVGDIRPSLSSSRRLVELVNAP